MAENAGCPRSVQIGPLRYDVEATDTAIKKAQVDMRSNLSGHIDYLQQQIVISPDQGPDELADTLLHEVLHAIFRMAGAVEAVKEEQMEPISLFLLDTLRRNPELVRFLVPKEDE